MRARPTPLHIVSILVVAGFVAVVGFGFQFGVGDAPPVAAWEEAARRVGAANVVSAVYLGVRLFDTILEVLVFAVAVLGVRHYLGGRATTGETRESSPESHIVRASAHVLLPLVILLGLSITIYGHITPGGGFSGGAITASGLLLVALALGGAGIAERFNEPLFERIEWSVLLALVGLALLPALVGQAPLSDLLPAGTLGRLNSGGSLLPLNLLIGLKVFIASWAIIHHFLRHRGEI
jgi:multicomponent Na+:H+ antiporter subunit B